MRAWLEFFAGAAEEHRRRGMRVEYAGVDRETNTFIWLRSFEDEAARVREKAGFYGSEWWTQREAGAMDHVLEYDVLFLDATLVRGGDDLATLPWPVAGDRPGSTPDAPPDGWGRSPRATFTRLDEGG